MLLLPLHFRGTQNKNKDLDRQREFWVLILQYSLYNINAFALNLCDWAILRILQENSQMLLWLRSYILPWLSLPSNLLCQHISSKSTMIKTCNHVIIWGFRLYSTSFSNHKDPEVWNTFHCFVYLSLLVNTVLLNPKKSRMLFLSIKWM